ncbi:hypothetical protein NW760_010257 [Fusarium oxysporum]|nr:hypothetical protein NW769_010040 [Fusarium oxysporum]KAJ4223641.1 hypothetical protein NW760_010257 [Fusarium oxysporum]
MQGKCSLSSSSVSRYSGAVNAGSHFASLNDTEPQRLHNVKQDLWQRTFQSVMANAHDDSPMLNLSFGLHGNSLSTLNSGSLSQPQQAHVFSSPDTLSHYNSASPPEPATTGPEFKNEPNEDATPAQVQSPRRWGSRPFSCPDCHTYTTNRKYNMNRHRETRHGKRRSSN